MKNLINESGTRNAIQIIIIYTCRNHTFIASSISYQLDRCKCIELGQTRDPTDEESNKNFRSNVFFQFLSFPISRGCEQKNVPFCIKLCAQQCTIK